MSDLTFAMSAPTVSSARRETEVGKQPKMSARSLDFFYDRFQALKDVNLHVARGEAAHDQPGLGRDEAQIGFLL